MSKKTPVLIIAGPTGSGKTALALDLARAFSGSVINADSMQVYEDLRVLTARPSSDEEVTVPHKLFGVLPASSSCSVGRWLEMAVAEIEVAWGQGRLPILAGGTAAQPDLPLPRPQDIARYHQRRGKWKTSPWARAVSTLRFGCSARYS